MTALAAPPPQLRTAQDLLHRLEQLEAQLDQVRQGLARSHRLTTLGMLSSVVAHEYNNILTSIISYCQLALAKPHDAALSRKAIEKSLAGAERAAKLSSSLLGFAADGPDAAAANLPRTVQEAIECLARNPSKDGIELTVDVPDVDLAIPPLNLQQVLLNLLLNARKAMRPNGGRLAVRASLHGRSARVWVRDTGPGIPPQIRQRLFQPFVTLSPSPQADSEPVQGTGLGLFICRDLVTSAGGRIGVESEPGRGAAFWFELPLAAAKAA